jgi:molecular chaperone HscB
MSAALPLACRACGAEHDGATAPVLCSACGAVLPVHARVSPYALLGLDRPRFAVDAKALERGWLERSRRVHPDRFAKKSDAERRAAAEQVAALNDAKRALFEPYDRALWLVRHAGVPAAELPQPRLFELMELREQAEADPAARARVVEEARRAFAARLAALAAALAPLDAEEGGYAAPSPALRKAAVLLAELKTLARLVADLGGGQLIGTLDDR